MTPKKKHQPEPMEYPTAWLVSEEDRLRAKAELQHDVATYAAFVAKKESIS